MRVLICGSRTWDDEECIAAVIAGLHAIHLDEPTLIHGDARGADRMAAMVAHRLGWNIEAYPADWEAHGKGAGAIRNQRMLDEGAPHKVYAFSDDLAVSRGTADMVRRARKSGLRVYVVGRAS